MSVVTDPENRYKFTTPPIVTNWAARTLDVRQKALYGPIDKAAADEKRPPPSHAGDMWRVELIPDE